MVKQSFTQNVKEEVCSANFTDEHLRSLLAAFIKISGSLSISSGESSIVMRTENAKIAKFIYASIQQIYGLPVRFAYTKAMNFSKKTTYNVIIEHEADYLLGDLEISFLDGKIAKNIIASDDMIAGYLSGAFLASGSVNSPLNSNYHLEIALNDESYAKWFTHLFARYHGGKFAPKIVKRRNQFVVYLKRSDQIADFLILIGATNAALDFENIRIDRDFSNIGNRLQNLDVANYSKTTNAAQNQIDDIRVIDKVLGLKHLNNDKQIALLELRLQHEDASLQELADLLSEKMDTTISRSNVNHIMRRTHLMAERYRKALK